MAPEIPIRLDKAGLVLLSGILTGQEEEVLAVMEKVGLRCREKSVEDIWVSLVLSR
jgi:ribosomal protein L11 methylase PrmA